MSANIPEHMLLSDLLKATGYNCPANLQGKTFKEATAGDQPAKLYAFGTAEGVVYTLSVPDADTAEIDVYVPAVTGLSKTTGSYTKEGNKVTVNTTDYARYDTGDLTL